MQPGIHNNSSNTNTSYGSGDIHNRYHVTNYLLGATETGEAVLPFRAL